MGQADLTAFSHARLRHPKPTQEVESRALSLCTCCRHYPGAAAGRRLRSFTQPYQPSPVWLPDRPAHRPFRGLLSVHSHCGLHTRAVANSRHANRRLQPSRYLHDCSDCFRLERVRRVGLTPTGKRRLCTAHAESCPLACWPPRFFLGVQRESVGSRSAQTVCYPRYR